MTKILVDRLVLEQALEALKCVDLQSLVPDYGSGHYSVSRLDGPQVKSAITVIEAALAEPVQEPVAWMTVRLNVPIQTTARKDVADEWLKWGEVQPLYTALSTEKIGKNL